MMCVWGLCLKQFLSMAREGKGKYWTVEPLSSLSVGQEAPLSLVTTSCGSGNTSI